MDDERYSYSNNQYPNDYHTQSEQSYRNVECNQDGTYRMSNPDRSYIPKEPEKKPKKPAGFLKKSLVVLGLGIFFGLSAGLAFYFVTVITGVNDLAQNEVTIKEQDVPIKEQASVSDSGIDTTSTTTVTTVVTDVTEVVDNVMPAVVSITNTFTEVNSFWGQSYSSEAQSSGSGIIVNENDEELLIVTNYHVVQDADSLKVQFIDDAVAEAQVKGTDSDMDLAVIAVKLDSLDASTKNAISLAKMGDSDSLKVGEPAIAIGNALGYGQSVTTGVISALDRQIAISEDGSTTGNLIQTDAAINPGNSGGALLNVKGEVIGINSNKIGGSAIEGMGYAIPISSAEPIIENLMLRETKDKVSEENKGYLGISGINVTTDVANMYGMPQGVYVTQVYEGTAAEKAGMLNGDIIVKFDGSGVGSMVDLQGYLEYYEKGESVEVTVMRADNGGYEEMTLTVVLGESVSAEPTGRR